MSLELVYTSAPRGLKMGSQGFCTVAASGWMPRAMMMKLEPLGAYEFAYELSDERASQNPVNYLHARVEIDGKPFGVISRVAFAGADYSGRINKIAHHCLLTASECMEQGPAWMLRQMEQREMLYRRWASPPLSLSPRSLDALLRAATGSAGCHCNAWRQAAGDAGYAGLLVQNLVDAAQPAVVIYNPGTDMLALFEEASALLEPAWRWNATFATYYCENLPLQNIAWRGVLAGSSAHQHLRRHGRGLVIDLTQPLPRVKDTAYVTAAREGKTVPVPAKSVPAASVPPIALRGGDVDLAPLEPLLGPDVGSSCARPVAALGGRGRTRMVVTAGAVALIAAVAAGLWIALPTESSQPDNQQAKLAPDDRGDSPQRPADRPAVSAGAGNALIDAPASPGTPAMPPRQPAATAPASDVAAGLLGAQTPAADVPAVSILALDDSLARGGNSRGGKTRVDGRAFTRQVVHGKRANGETRFNVGSANRFVQPPSQLRLHGEIQKRSSFVVSALDYMGMPEAIAACQLVAQDGGNVVVCRIGDALPPALQEQARFLVIEVADADSATLYQCVLGVERRDAPVLGLTIGSDAAAKVIGSSEDQFDYAWPESLNSDRQLSIAPPAPSTQMKVSAFRPTMRMKLAPAAQSQVLASVQSNVPAEVAASLRASESDRKRLDRQIEDLNKQILPLAEAASPTRGEMALRTQLEQKKTQAQQQLTELQSKRVLLVDTYRKVIEQSNPIVIEDAWGVPVVQIEVRLNFGQAGQSR